LTPLAYTGKGRPPVQPVSVKQLAMGLPTQAYQMISWREGTNATLSG